MYYILVLLIAGLDQLTKALVRSDFSLGESRPLIEGVFHLTYIENTGAAFSSFEGQRLLLTLLPLILTAVFLFLLATWKRKGAHWTALFAFALIAAGGIGNLIDRCLRGSVTDFLDFRFWPVFNVADIAVCVGCGFLVIFVFFFDRRKEEKDASDSAGEDLKPDQR